MLLQYSKHYKILFWLVLVSSYVLAVIPQEMAPEIGDLSDKTLHFIAFAVLTLFLKLAYPIRWWKGVLYLLGYAFFIEFSQYFTPNRCAEWWDIVADGIGIVLGLFLYAAYKKLEEICENS